MRRRFGRMIAGLADQDEHILMLVGDIGYRVFDEFRARHPDRFINMGICEQSLIGVAAGLALEGLKPWVDTITPFLIERPFEQIKLDIDQQQANVKLVGFSDYPTLGPTHTELDATKLIGLCPNVTAYFPSDGDETACMVKEAYQTTGPAFISLKTDPLLDRSITS